jgi:phage tail sheath protein FI
MPEYLSPGVYVEEVPSAIKPIAGVSTSTAGFVGVVKYPVTILEPNPDYDPTRKATPVDPTKPETKPDPTQPDSTKRYLSWQFPLPDTSPDKTGFEDARDEFNKVAEDADARLPQPKGLKDAANAAAKSDILKKFRDAQARLALATRRRASGITQAELHDIVDPKVPTPVLCTSFADFTKHFGSLSSDGGYRFVDTDQTLQGGQNALAQAVWAFFNNGGTRCYVMVFSDTGGLQDPESLMPFEAIDEISIVAAPGIYDQVVQTNLLDHCENLKDRFAILDPPPIPEDGSVELTEANIKVARDTDYGALYFPRIKVFSLAAKLLEGDFTNLDPDTKKPQPCKDGEIYVSPTGHVAGIYSRTDHERGVHKAPANEVVHGALELEFSISRNMQDGLNPGGVNCIRKMPDGDIRVWGARTIGGDANADLKYINVRRTLIFLRESIDRGTQWVVFEPNDRALWQKIVRNVSAFLTSVWRDGALFGSTPQEAFFVRCDDVLNPPEERDLGKVTTEIGVAIVRPAEFVIFRIEQWQGPTA